MKKYAFCCKWSLTVQKVSMLFLGPCFTENVEFGAYCFAQNINLLKNLSINQCMVEKYQ